MEAAAHEHRQMQGGREGFFLGLGRERVGGAKPGYGLTSLFVRKCLLHDTASVRCTGNVFLSFILQTLPDKYSDDEALKHVHGSVLVHARALVRTWGLKICNTIKMYHFCFVVSRPSVS